MSWDTALSSRGVTMVVWPSQGPRLVDIPKLVYICIYKYVARIVVSWIVVVCSIVWPMYVESWIKLDQREGGIVRIVSIHNIHKHKSTILQSIALLLSFTITTIAGPMRSILHWNTLHGIQDSDFPLFRHHHASSSLFCSWVWQYRFY